MLGWPAIAELIFRTINAAARSEGPRNGLDSVPYQLLALPFQGAFVGSNDASLPHDTLLSQTFQVQVNDGGGV